MLLSKFGEKGYKAGKGMEGAEESEDRDDPRKINLAYNSGIRMLARKTPDIINDTQGDK